MAQKGETFQPAKAETLCSGRILSAWTRQAERLAAATGLPEFQRMSPLRRVLAAGWVSRL